MCSSNCRRLTNQSSTDSFGVCFDLDFLATSDSPRTVPLGVVATTFSVIACYTTAKSGEGLLSEHNALIFRLLSLAPTAFAGWIAALVMLFSGMESLRAIAPRSRLRLPPPFVYHFAQFVVPTCMLTAITTTA